MSCESAHPPATHHDPRPTAHQYLIGVTGNIASGKSTVADMLGDLGAVVVDADALVHRLLEPGTEAYDAVVARFGRAILLPEGGIDRPALGRVVFADPAALADLEGILHPAVRRAFDALLRELPQDAVVAYHAVKLVEGGQYQRMNSLWLVVCDPAEQERRLVQERHMRPEDARQRLAAQPPLEPKRQLADVVIDNSGPLARTREQVQAAWLRLVKPALSRPL